LKIYRIKIDDVFYVKAVVFDTSQGELKFQVIPTWDVLEAAWYDEEKAKKYIEELNKEYKEDDVEIKFTLDYVKELSEGVKDSEL